ncbi:MAG: hypothetical protein IJ137_11545 [Eubacterium sp.]|nr:hypothetical protein [Eubacterium sp.]
MLLYVWDNDERRRISIITIDLLAEGVFGERLARYLETHMKEAARIRYYTHPDQWESESLTADLCILSRDFYPGRSDQKRFSETELIWISDQEQEEGYCIYHPPWELIDLIELRLHQAAGRAAEGGYSSQVTVLFAPVPGQDLMQLAQLSMTEGDLYLGMEDQRIHSMEEDRLCPGNMGDLCYYIHLREEEIPSRIRELSSRTDIYDILPGPPFILPLLELGSEDYVWFFDTLRKKKAFSHIYIGLGYSMLGSGKILPQADRLLLFGNKDDPGQMRCCENMVKALEGKTDLFRGKCEIISLKGHDGYAG